MITRSGDYRAYANLAEVRLQEGNLNEAERLLQVASRVENVTVYQNLAVLHFQQRRYAEARDDGQRALAILRKQGWDPDVASVLYYNLGAVYARLGEREKTIEALNAALRENPRNEQARAQLDRLSDPGRGS